MPTVTHSLDIPAEAEQVWAIATDMSRYGEWNVTHTGFPEGPPQPEPGAKFKEQITIMGMPGEASWTVTETIAPTRTVWDGEGPMGIRLGSRLELAPNGGDDDGDDRGQLRRRPAVRPTRRVRGQVGREGRGRVAREAEGPGRLSV